MISNLSRFRKMLSVCLITLTFSLNSCYSYRVGTIAQAGAEASKPITAHSFLWGLAKSPKEIRTPVCDSLEVNGMAEVTVKTNFVYALITVVTLGIWSPMKVEWKCGKPCKKSTTL